MADAFVAGCGVFGCWAKTSHARNIKSTKSSFNVCEQEIPVVLVHLFMAQTTYSKIYVFLASRSLRQQSREYGHFTSRNPPD